MLKSRDLHRGGARVVEWIFACGCARLSWDPETSTVTDADQRLQHPFARYVGGTG